MIDRRQIPYTGTPEGRASFWRRFTLFVVAMVLVLIALYLAFLP